VLSISWAVRNVPQPNLRERPAFVKSIQMFHDPRQCHGREQRRHARWAAKLLAAPLETGGTQHRGKFAFDELEKSVMGIHGRLVEFASFAR
jgi:hypothetical protein